MKEIINENYFDEISKNRPQQPQKELGEYFQWLHFLNQWLPLIKMHYNIPHFF